MNKLAKLIENMGEEDLKKIKRDLLAGNIDRLISVKLYEKTIDKYSNKICPVCGGAIGEDSLVLEFGSTDLRRKAHFDGVDCLEYFVSRRLKATAPLPPSDSE